MKIYCGRSRYNPDSDEEILDSLIGKDLWVRVKSGVDDQPYWIRIIGKDNGMYLASKMYDYCEEFDAVIPKQSLKYKSMILENTLDYFSLDDKGRTPYRFTTVCKPLQIVTSDEIFV